MPAAVSKPIVSFGKFLITMAMAASGLNTNLVSLIKNGGKPIFLGPVSYTHLDFTLLRAFMAAGKPVFGIGRGLQVVNVVQGGSLYTMCIRDRDKTGQTHPFYR